MRTGKEIGGPSREPATASKMAEQLRVPRADAFYSFARRMAAASSRTSVVASM